MIVLFTDFGVEGPYIGQVEAVLHRDAPHIASVDLFVDAPTHDPKAAAYLLAGYVEEFPAGTVFLAVVDPGVGGERRAVMLLADGRWYVGPENGLFELIIRRASEPSRWWNVTWRPERLSATFHGRDLFAPVAARLALGGEPPGEDLPTKSDVWIGLMTWRRLYTWIVSVTQFPVCGRQRCPRMPKSWLPGGGSRKQGRSPMFQRGRRSGTRIPADCWRWR
jgi:S-adenosylmethionine hydrolase